MKTHIVQLEQHDDIVSARDRMGWSKAERILIVWPEHGSVLNRRLDLLLLQRHSAELGAQLALVSKDREVRYHAPRLGILVYKSLRKAQSSHWRTPRRYRQTRPARHEAASSPVVEDTEIREPAEITPRLPPRPLTEDWTPKPVTRLFFFVLGVAAFLAIAALLLPGAEVRLTPERRTQDTTIAVRAGSDVEAVRITGELPARPVTVIVEGRLVDQTSGTIILPGQPALGEVVFTNLTDQAVPVPAGAVVRSLEPPYLRFEVTRSGEAPAGPGQEVRLPVRALTPGAAGNLPAGSLQAIEGLLGTQVSANNPAPIRSGTDRSEPAPSETDRQRLHAELLASLEESALQELQASLQAGDILLDSDLELAEILEEAYTPADLQPSDHLEHSLRLAFQGWVVSGEDLQSLASQVFDSSLPAGFSVLPRSLQVQALSPPKMQPDGSAAWSLGANRLLEAQVHAAQVVRLALGQAPVEAIRRIQAGLPVEAAPVIRLTPSWWPRLPVLPFRINVLVEGGDL